jgi:hypothetical protein
MFFGVVLGDGSPVEIPETGFIGTAMIGDFTIPLVGSVEGVAADGTGELGIGERDLTRQFV